MAIRYSGDTEIRLQWRPRYNAYQGSVRDPYKRWEGMWISHHPDPHDPISSEAYDRAAIELIRVAERWAKTRSMKPFEIEKTNLGRIRIRRVFQAPCPREEVSRIRKRRI